MREDTQGVDYTVWLSRVTDTDHRAGTPCWSLLTTTAAWLARAEALWLVDWRGKRLCCTELDDLGGYAHPDSRARQLTIEQADTLLMVSEMGGRAAWDAAAAALWPTLPEANIIQDTCPERET